MMSIGRFLSIYGNEEIMFEGLGIRTGYEWKRYFQQENVRMTSVIFGFNLNPRSDCDVYAWMKNN